MNELRDIWDRLKDAAGVKECVVCGEIITDVLSKHSQRQTGLDLCVRHLKMYRDGNVDWDGHRFVENK